MHVEIDATLITREPANDVGEHLERVWCDGRHIPRFRYVLDGVSREEWVTVCEEARLRIEAGYRPGVGDHLPYA